MSPDRTALLTAHSHAIEASERRAQVQGDYWLPSGEPGRDPGTITWDEHNEIWGAYAKEYGSGQSPERIAERGGFGWSEIVKLTGAPPKTWIPDAPR
jgi:hypothetical protein